MLLASIAHTHTRKTVCRKHGLRYKNEPMSKQKCINSLPFVKFLLQTSFQIIFQRWALYFLIVTDEKNVKDEYVKRFVSEAS